MSTAIILLAAGQGTRMNSDLPKVLHRLAGAPLLHHAMRSGAALGAERMVVVTGHGSEAVRKAAQAQDEDAVCVVQEEQLGTAHAVAQARDALAGFEGDAIVLYGDTPFVRPETLEAMQEARASGAAVVVLGFVAGDPAGYGRLILDAGGALQAIVEHKDATEAQQAIRLCNSGVVCADAATLFDLVAAVGNANAKGEYYLTDIVGLARARDLTCAVVTCDEAETMGVNSRQDLARAEAVFQARARAEALENGVTLTAPETVFFAFDTVVGRDVTIAPFVTFGPDVTVESGAEIRAFCHLEGCHISEGAQIGPYARLRPGAEIGEDARIGNFVEVKAAQVGRGAKVNHLSYVGDASVGEGANIGAGTITCNYDGVFKHRTVIGDGAFIGSNTALVAPVTVHAGGYVGSGSVVTMDVPSGDLAISRARQVNKAGLGARMMARLKALKAKGRD
ncbi:bifunctional UDP-N-acetylglucosamine diphosphorylase/glucosamine-1-phosphate N-acetyltransferase GlmU [Halovulum dunhuangense]|uniref:Bifunctional protein GlmU n=1 Tax=Halovulum dunhuangense TaxID=1505036 RepID=A0A849L414_9RHOB|nr:bifunctional UDP-N-acetylglucosamine diphosphorylase/glucosamine-1-phosphate N-acetyltransferase GlmU [Halovulum dunhuangense]NNU81096.1 bifunctional UDP-N-acetylglucosamine diphosphorylase/glucosamine-1-phosphate N-acetyltransferase GlmU [Halovulum dunhuangense]